MSAAFFVNVGIGIYTEVQSRCFRTACLFELLVLGWFWWGRKVPCIRWPCGDSIVALWRCFSFAASHKAADSSVQQLGCCPPRAIFTPSVLARLLGSAPCSWHFDAVLRDTANLLAMAWIGWSIQKKLHNSKRNCSLLFPNWKCCCHGCVTGLRFLDDFLFPLFVFWAAYGITQCQNSEIMSLFSVFCPHLDY